eukprot:GHVN01006997.1.p1 GENE.GHVN01006997.1~~GHVN01006997.1.p1  ORF type:complete len:201 (+),score=4.36 GHVN01006997.1:32-604(+)
METEKRLTILEYSALYPNFASKQSGNEFPFLLKCLSVSKALSIQVHPDKPTAEQLHASDPATYTDPNHKPEMAIALTEFEAMCGFREPLTILNELKQVRRRFLVIQLERITSRPPSLGHCSATLSQKWELKMLIVPQYCRFLVKLSVLLPKWSKALLERFLSVVQTTPRVFLQLSCSCTYMSSTLETLAH